MQKIVPYLWFDNQAEEAARLYVSLFPGSEVASVSRYGEEGAKVAGRPAGSAMTVTFRLQGEEFIALNGGPVFTFTPAISLFVNCVTQGEIDRLWDRLTDGGEPGQCGWLKDRFGVSWQIVPTALGEMLQDRDPEKSRRVMSAMLKMKKLDLAVLRQAYEQE
jgi:predicted 3-demethylubiquinone-9 3-methyltransferase (glyoxalase superfamily)